MATAIVQVNIRMPASLHAELAAFAAQDERSLTAIIVRAARDYLTSNGPGASPLQANARAATKKESTP